MRELAKAASDDLRRRVSDLFESEALRFMDLLPDPQLLRQSAWEIERAIEELDESPSTTESLA